MKSDDGNALMGISSCGNTVHRYITSQSIYGPSVRSNIPYHWYLKSLTMILRVALAVKTLFHKPTFASTVGD
jgi:hypothetical protein